MGDVILCRIDEEKYSTIENNKTDVNSSINKDIKNNDDKDIVLNINKENKNKKNIKISNETLKGNTEYIKIFLKGEDHKSTDNNSLINLNNKESNISKGKISFKKNNIPKIYKLISGCIENICCISLVNDILNFSIGDKEIIHCEKITSFFGNDLSM